MGSGVDFFLKMFTTDLPSLGIVTAFKWPGQCRLDDPGGSFQLLAVCDSWLSGSHWTVWTLLVSTCQSAVRLRDELGVWREGSGIRPVFTYLFPLYLSLDSGVGVEGGVSEMGNLKNFLSPLFRCALPNSCPPFRKPLPSKHGNLTK